MSPPSTKERNLLKGAMRRVFSRSDLRRQVLEEAKVSHLDILRPRVKTWYKCAECGVKEAGFRMQVDHVIPVVPLNKSFDEMSFDELVSNLWCDKSNLSALCEPCHKTKSKAENKLRREYKKNVKCKAAKRPSTSSCKRRTTSAFTGRASSRARAAYGRAS